MGVLVGAAQAGAIFEFGCTLENTNPFSTNLSRRAQNSHDNYAYYIHTVDVQLQTCGTSRYFNLCFTHIAARSLALVSKIRIRSARKLSTFEARKALKCTARMASFAHPE